MKQVSARWYEWSRYAPVRRLDVHGHFLAGSRGEPGVIVDPVPLHEGDREHIAELGGAAAVVLTGPAREREAERCAKALGCRLFAAYDDPAAALPADLLAIMTPVPPRRQSRPPRPQGPGSTRAAPRETSADPREVALYHKDTATALVGACVIGLPAGFLTLSTADAAPDPPAGGLPRVAAGIPGAAAEPDSAAARTVRALRGLLSAGRVETLLVGAGTSLVSEPARALQDLVYRYDPHAMLLRPDELRWTPPAGVRTVGARFGSRYAEGARPLGLRVLDFEVTEVPPGRQGGQLHRHDGHEELFVVLSGRGELVTEHATVAVRAGDLMGFPPRYQIPHAFRNTGDTVLRYLAFGAPAETLDMLDYLEAGVRAEYTRYGKHYRFRLPEERDIPYWENVPTD